MPGRRPRERQTIYKELKNAGLTKGGPNPLQKKWAGILGLRNYQPPALRGQQYQRPTPPRNQVVPMDVDATHFTPLTPDERTALYNACACFYCKKPGHISKDCHAKAAAMGRGQGSRARVATAAVAPAPPKEEKSMADTIRDLEGVKGMVAWVKDQPMEVKETFVDELQDF